MDVLCIGNSVINNSFADFDEEIPPEVVAKIKECVEKM